MSKTDGVNGYVTNANEVRRILRAHRGPILARLNSRDGVHWVRVYKADLLVVLAKVVDDQVELDTGEAGEDRRGIIYVDRAD